MGRFARQVDYYSGPCWQGGAPASRWIEVEGVRIRREGEGESPAPSRSVVFVDELVNWHTHLGDAFLAGEPLPRDLETLVKPGVGYKHRRLAEAPRDQIVAGIAGALEAFAASGMEEVWDFREQGPAGLLMVREAARRLGARAPTLRLLGRPAQGSASEAELEALLHLADGLGLPSITDLGVDACRELAEAVHAQRKLVAIHASEGTREPIEDILGLEPDLLVHLCHASPGDLERVRAAGVPVAVCPTSNAYFGLRSPVDQLERLGIPWGFGTDNAMFGFRSLLTEVRQAREWFPQLVDEVWLRALSRRLEKPINQVGPLKRVTRPRRVLALPLRHGQVAWSDEPRILER